MQYSYSYASKTDVHSKWATIGALHEAIDEIQKPKHPLVMMAKKIFHQLNTFHNN